MLDLPQSRGDWRVTAHMQTAGASDAVGVQPRGGQAGWALPVGLTVGFTMGCSWKQRRVPMNPVRVCQDRALESAAGKHL